MSHPRHRAARSGFTLIEILTATAVMSVIVAMVLTVVTMVMNTWTNSSDKLSMSTQARVVLDLVAQDLQGAIFRRTGTAEDKNDADNPQWFCLETERTETTDSHPQSRVMFFASTTQREEEALKGGATVPIYGDVCAIQYRVRYEPVFANNPAGAKAFVLHRAVANARSTLMGFNGTSTNATDRMLGSAYLKDMWDRIDNKGDGTDIVDELTVYGATAEETAIAYNVARFKIIYYRHSQDLPGGANDSLPGAVDTRTGMPSSVFGPQPLLDSKDPNRPTDIYYGGYRDNIFDTKSDLRRGFPNYSTLPAFADIVLTLITEEGAIQYDLQSGNIGDWDEFLNKYGQTYTQRVYFSNRPQ